MSTRRSAAKASTRLSRRMASSSEDEDDPPVREGAGAGEDSSSAEEYEPPASTSASRSKATQQHAFSTPASAASTTVVYGEDDVQRLVADATLWVLAQERRRAPVKRPDLFKAVNLTGKARDLQERVWDGLEKVLKRVFGLVLQESVDKKGSWFLLNRLQEMGGGEEHQHLEWSDRENAQQGLLFAVLGLIFMNNDVVTDEALFKFLGQLGVMEDHSASSAASRRASTDEQHRHRGVNRSIEDLFGDVKQLVFREWGQRQQYLDIKRIDTGDTDHQVEIARLP